MKYLIIISTITLALIFSAYSVNGQEITENKKAAWTQFKAEEGTEWEVRWNKHGEAPRSLFAGKSVRFQGTPEAIARQFLAKHKELFSFENDLKTLKYRETKSRKGTSTVILDQVYKGLPVYGAEYRVHILSDGSINLVTGHYYPNISLSKSTSISEIEASTIAVEHLAEESNALESSNEELVVFVKDEHTFHLSYKFDVHSNNKRIFWNVFVDAKSGEVLKANNLNVGMGGAEPPNLQRKLSPKFNGNQKENANKASLATGLGNVFATHPGLNSNLTSGYLWNLNSPTKLNGTYLKVGYFDDQFKDIGASYYFNYSETDDELDEVMAYHHSENFRRNYISNIDSDVANQMPKTVINVRAGSCSAFYYPGPKKITLGTNGYVDNDNCNKASREDKVIMHEYMHAVTHKLNGSLVNISSDTERALIEGLADYFPGSYTDRPELGDYMFANHDSDYRGRREMDDPDYDVFGDIEYDVNGDFEEVYIVGEFFSSILWDIRSDASNSDDIDEVIFYSIETVNNDPDFLDFRNVMIAKDQAMNSGANWKMIQNRFADKGVGMHAPLDVDITGPSSITSGVNATWTASSSDGQSPLQYEWKKIPFGGGSGTVVGTGSSYTGTNTSDFYIQATITDSRTHEGYLKNYITVTGGGCQPGFPCKPIAPGTEQPESFSLEQNYPNPFNPSTEITYALPEAAEVVLKVYNIMGQEVATLINNNMSAGFHSITFDANTLPSGVYIARMDAVGQSGTTFTKELKMQLIK